MEEYIGMIKIFAGNFAPKGWQYCDGRALEIHRFENLYSLIGNTYGGSGNMFNLPNLNGRVPIGPTTAYPVGNTGGHESIVITKDQMPPHTHGTTVSASLNVSNTVADTQIPADGLSIAAPSQPQGREKGPINGFVSGDPNVKLSAKTSNVTVALTTEGGTTAVNIMQPYLSMSYIICVEGMYPPHP